MYNPLVQCTILVYGQNNLPIIRGYLTSASTGCKSVAGGSYLFRNHYVYVTLDKYCNMVCLLNGKRTERFTIIPTSKRQKRIFGHS